MVLKLMVTSSNSDKANSNRVKFFLDNPIQIAHHLRQGKHGHHPVKDLGQYHD